MTRIVDLTGPRAPMRFQLLWAALQAGGDGKGERGPAVIRREARLQEALDAISDPGSANGTGDPGRVLRAEGAAVTLAQEDFDVLQQYAEKTPWTPRVARDVVDLWDFLSACEKQE